MENNLKVFSNEEFGEVRTILNKEEVYFVGRDVARALGYKDTASAIKSHVDEEDKLTRQFAVSGQRRNMVVINESGLYSLVLSSKLPNAKKFRRWVTSEVLPSIRQNGAYVNLEGADPSLLEDYAKKIYQLAQEKRETAKLQKQVQEMKPALDYCNKILTCDKTATYTATQIVKTLGLDMTVHELNEYLVKKGFLLDQSYTNKKGKICHKYYPTAKASRGGYVEFYNFEDKYGANRCAFKFTEKCRTAIFKSLEKEAI